MPNSRLPVPTDVADEVLYRNDHICCICNVPRKHVQIHHIDENPGNNEPDNLAVVCLDCHSLITGAHGLGRRYGPGEVRKYKRTWERVVLYKRSSYKPPSRAGQRELIGQVDLIICQILATSDYERQKEKLELLYNLHLWRGTPQIDRQILEGFGHLAVMSGLSMPRLAKEVASKVWEMCWHFVGPHHVRMDTAGTKFVVRCADVAESLVIFNCGHQQNLGVLRATLETAENIFDVAMWYRKELVAKAVVKVLTKALDACKTGEHLDFPAGVRVLTASAKTMARKLELSTINWPQVARKLRAIAAPPHAVSDRDGTHRNQLTNQR